MRFCFYSHDGYGLGHTQRNLAIATAITRLLPDASVLLATGTEIVGSNIPAQVEILKLPGLKKIANEHYVSRRLPIPEAEIRSLRSGLLASTVENFRPSVLLADKHPFGVGGELRAALATLRRNGGGCAVLGLRDVLDEPATVLREWAPHHLQDEIAANYDRILVYGHRKVFDPIREYKFPETLRERTCFCGYVVNDAATPRSQALDHRPLWTNNSKPVVVATAGGGEDGAFILEAFMRACAGARWRGVAVAGPMIPEDQRERLERLALETRVSLRSFVPSLSSCFDKIDTLVSMGGYNTLAEALSQGTPTVCVPRTYPRAEQSIRARAFSKLGLLRIILPEELTVARLTHEIALSLQTCRQEILRRSEANLRFDGARVAARELINFNADVMPHWEHDLENALS